MANAGVSHIKTSALIALLFLLRPPSPLTSCNCRLGHRQQLSGRPRHSLPLQAC